MAELDELLDQPSESQKRITQLSNNLKTTAEEREAAKAEAGAAQAKVAEVERERDFYVGFSDVVANNPAAREHQADILSKVKTGYTVEDATYAVLGKAGKLGQPKVETQTIAGGSAVITPPQGDVTKRANDMTQAERRSALLEAEARGDLSVN